MASCFHTYPPMQLYKELGYAEVAQDPVFTPQRRCLMRKAVEPLQCSGGSGGGKGSGGATNSGSNGGSSGNGSGGSSEIGGSRDSAGSAGAGSTSAGVYVWPELDAED